MSETISLDTEYGQLLVTHDPELSKDGFAAHSEPPFSSPTFVRIHSSCAFSESLHALDCDCARQLDAALKYIAAHGGVLIYLFQEGRGIGISDKIRAIAIEERTGCNTVQSFSKLGHNQDPRTYEVAVRLLNTLGVTDAVLATSNPRKTQALRDGGINVSERINLSIEHNEKIVAYLESKKPALGFHEDN